MYFVAGINSMRVLLFPLLTFVFNYSVRYTKEQQKVSRKIAFIVYSSYALIHLTNQSNRKSILFKKLTGFSWCRV
jgi:hypothetical protein